MEDRTCIYCAAVLIDPRQKVCAEHRLHHRRILHQRRLGREWATPECVGCGVVLESRALSAKRCATCSRAERTREQRERKTLQSGPKPGRACRQCGTPIDLERRRDAVTCSRTCLELWRSRNVDRSMYLEATREQRRIAAKAWRHANPARARSLVHRRRTRLKTGTVHDRDWRRLVHRHGGCCAYCGVEAEMTMDHVVPVSRGGVNTIGNILPACLTCNSSKSNKLLVEWRARKLALAA